MQLAGEVGVVGVAERGEGGLLGLALGLGVLAVGDVGRLGVVGGGFGVRDLVGLVVGVEAAADGREGLLVEVVVPGAGRALFVLPELLAEGPVVLAERPVERLDGG